MANPEDVTVVVEVADLVGAVAHAGHCPRQCCHHLNAFAYDASCARHHRHVVVAVVAPVPAAVEELQLLVLLEASALQMAAWLPRTTADAAIHHEVRACALQVVVAAAQQVQTLAVLLELSASALQLAQAP